MVLAARAAALHPQLFSREDVWTRTLPALVFFFILGLLLAVDYGLAWWQNVLLSAAGLAIGIAAFVGVNKLRGRRLFQRPDSVGIPELTLFVFVEPLIFLITGLRWDAALVSIGANVVLLAIIYWFASYGIIPMTRWAIVRVFSELGSSLGLFARALPLLLIFTTFLFINADVWQVGNDLTQATAWAVSGLFLAIGLVFLLTRLPRELEHVGALREWPTVVDDIAGTPAARLAEWVPGPAHTDSVAALSRRERGNLSLVIIWAHGLQILMVAVLVGAFFALFGLLIVTPEIIVRWTGAAPDCATLFGWTILCYPESGIVLSTVLVHVAGFLAAFSGLYFTVYVITDKNYREEFFEELLGEVRVAVEVRAVYRCCVTSGP